MSFEGYYQMWCEKGHYFTEDANSSRLYFSDPLEANIKCPICKSKLAFWNLVNIINGPYKEISVRAKRIDGYIEPELKSIKTCDKCGSVLEEIYEIPKTKRR